MTSPVYGDRVQETFTTTGTGAISLGGPVVGYQAFSAVLANAQTCFYTATDGTNWETGLGTFTSAGDMLARTTVLSSSNANAAVNWLAGTKSIWLDFPAAGLAPNTYQATPGNPTGTVSSTMIQMGFGAPFTPSRTGAVLAIMSGYLQNTSTGGAGAVISYGTGVAPVNGAATTGSQVGNQAAFNPSSTGGAVPFSCQAIITNLVIGTAYWFDLNVERITAAGTASANSVGISILEIK